MATGSDAPDSSKPAVRVGDVLLGKYRVDRVLGAGGMGTVVAARHLKLDQEVAIKLLLADVRDKPNVRARFAREARAAAGIKNEHVVRILDVDEAADGTPFIVMEHLDGVDLEALLKRDARLSLERTVDFMLQACEGLAAAHALGIVHRDLKPANLFVTQGADGAAVIKLLDFGISKAGTRDGAAGDLSLTHETSVIGSPYYMSPEQLRSSKDVDHRADIWSLGVVLYRCLAGELPFKGTSVTSLAARIAADPPDPIRGALPDVSPGAEAVVLRCLEKEPAKRYATVTELAHALAEQAPGLSRVSDRSVRIVRAGAPPRSGPPASVDPAADTIPGASGSGAREGVASGGGAAARVTAELAAPSAAEPAVAALSVTEHTSALVTNTRPAPRRRWGLPALVAAGAVCAIAGVGVWRYSTSTPRTDGPAAANGNTPTTTAATGDPAATASALASASVSATVAPSVSASVPTAAIPDAGARALPTKRPGGETAPPPPTGARNPLEVKIK